MAELTKVTHPFDPIYNAQSQVLILGSLPSQKSREQNFFYGHPRNRFWKVLAAVFDEPVPDSIEAKKELLLTHHVAVWDVIASCSIKGSSDASITDVIPTDLSTLLENSRIHTILCNGRTAERFYLKFQYSRTGIEPVFVPSTSPANAACSLEKLISLWKPALLGALDEQK